MRYYTDNRSMTSRDIFVEDDSNLEILRLRKLGMSIAEISEHTGSTLTEVCDVIYEQNNRDKQNS